jgi:hypothetical protein
MGDSLLTRLLTRAGHRLRPLFAPDAERDRARIETILTEQRDTSAVLQKRTRAQAERVTEVMREVEQLRKHTSALRSRLTRQLQFSERVLKRVSERSVELNEERVLDRLARLAKSDQPILVGPWTGEVGFELIYWIPFVRWAIGHAAIDPARVTIFSRGGPRAWYDGLGVSYLDVLDLSTADEFRAATALGRKQRAMTAYDRELARRAGRRLGLSRAALIHPAMMYPLFMPYWRREAPLPRLAEYSRYRRYAPPPLPETIARLPERFVAVRFYFSECFPDTPENRHFVAQTIDALAATRDVVVLRAGINLDDHSDAGAVGSRRGRVLEIDAGISPRENLAMQTAIIARAESFVGTYGGFSYLAPLHGVDTVAFYSLANFQVSHLHAAQHIIETVAGGALTPVAVAQAALVRDAAGGALVAEDQHGQHV